MSFTWPKFHQYFNQVNFAFRLWGVTIRLVLKSILTIRFDKGKQRRANCATCRRARYLRGRLGSSFGPCGTNENNLWPFGSLGASNRRSVDGCLSYTNYRIRMLPFGKGAGRPQREGAADTQSAVCESG